MKTFVLVLTGMMVLLMVEGCQCDQMTECKV